MALSKIDAANFLTGTIPSGNIATSSLAAAATGKVLQVIQGTTTTQVDTSSSSFVDTGLSASITPSSTSNKVLIIVALGIFNYSTDKANVNILRDSTQIIEQGYAPWDTANYLTLFNFQYLDTPSTTSAITYKVQIKDTGGASGISVNYDDSGGDQTSMMTLMEVAG